MGRSLSIGTGITRFSASKIIVLADKCSVKWETSAGYGRVFAVVLMLAWPVVALSIVLIVLSGILTMFILLHKGRGGGMGDLFGGGGGGMTSTMGGTSVRERNLDRITIIVSALWVLVIVALLMVYRFGDPFSPADPISPNASAEVTDTDTDADTGTDTDADTDTDTDTGTDAGTDTDANG
jgi:preprotein translocase subunit SecG